MTRTMTATKAKAELASCIRLARHGEPTVITNHGRPVAVLVSTEDFDRLERLRAAGPEGGLASIAGGWEGSTHLIDRALVELRQPDAAEQVEPAGLNGASGNTDTTDGLPTTDPARWQSEAERRVS